ncbi:TPA: hypothetical protein N2D99_002236 [Clostridium botulinum]|nr:hypothetical protein [Clostridium botulinum]
MENTINKVYEDLIDISDSNISTHALVQYNTKCFPGLDLVRVVERMRDKLKRVKRVELNKKRNNDGTYFIDEDDIIYIVNNNNIITTYPNTRILKAKPIHTIKKTGQKWM